MLSFLIQRRPMVLRALIALTVMLLLLALNPAAGSAQILYKLHSLRSH